MAFIIGPTITEDMLKRPLRKSDIKEEKGMKHELYKFALYYHVAPAFPMLGIAYTEGMATHKLVYQGLAMGRSAFEAANFIFDVFNNDHPEDFHKRSMSIGDVVVLSMIHGGSVALQCNGSKVGWSFVEMSLDFFVNEHDPATLADAIEANNDRVTKVVCPECKGTYNYTPAAMSAFELFKQCHNCEAAEYNDYWCSTCNKYYNVEHYCEMLDIINMGSDYNDEPPF